MKKLTIVVLVYALLFGCAFLSQAVAANGEWPTVEKKITHKFKEEMKQPNNSDRATQEADDTRPFSTKYLLAESERYELIDSAVITGANGKAISADELEIPCVAEIEYQKLSTGGKNIISLKVLKNLSPSTTDWNQEMPD